MVTIITTTKNRKAFLEKATRSVLSQDYPHIEHIVIDGGSSDGTPEFLKRREGKYKDRGFILKWISEKDNGQAEAMNKGARMAAGEYIAFLNDDDFLEPGAVKAFAEVFEAHPEIDFVYGDNHKLDSAIGKKELVSYRFYSLHDMTNGGYQIPSCASMFRRALFAKAGYFDESLRHVAEHDLFTRFTENGARLYYFPVPFETIVEHPGRGTNAFFLRSLRETKSVNFRHGASRLSRFYLLYLRDRYFGRLFGGLKSNMPRLYNVLKHIFNNVTP